MHSFSLRIKVDNKKPPSYISSSLELDSIVLQNGLCRIVRKYTDNFISCISCASGWIVSSGTLAADKKAQQTVIKKLESGLSAQEIPLCVDGQYTAVCYIESGNELTFLSDPSGIRSLYYTKSDGYVYVGSSLAAVRDILPEKSCLSTDVVDQSYLMRYGYIPPGRTVYANIFELLPGNTMVLSLTDGEVKLKSPYVSRTSVFDKQADEDSLYNLLIKITRKQLGGVEKAGVLLGGFDSALVASLLKKCGAEVETFSFAYDNESFNQPLIKEFSDYLGTKHHWIHISPDVIREGISNYSDHCSMPTIWPNYVIQTQYVCQIMAEQGINFCFSGDGCDTAFMGYPSTYRRGGVYQKIPKIAPVISNVLVALLVGSKLEYVAGHLYRVAVSLLRAAIFDVESRPLRSFQVFDPSSFRLLNPAMPPHFEEHEAIQNAVDRKFKYSSYERRMYYGKSLISPNRVKLASSSDVGGFVINSPYLDPELKSFAEKIPDHLLRPEGGLHTKEGKYILMKMAENKQLLPSEIIYQDKVAAIRSPVDEWYSGVLNKFIKEHLKNLPMSPDRKYIESLLKDMKLEKLYKNYFSDDFVVSLAASLLITYASFFKKIP